MNRELEDTIENLIGCIEQNIRWIMAEIKKYEQSEHQTWAHAGELGHVEASLADIYEFLNGDVK